jgi:3-keto-disaccharide hydrolase
MLRTMQRLGPLLAAALAVAGSVRAADWISLFDGTTLTGWRQYGGRATFEVKDGAIVGTHVLEAQNSFLATERELKDFVLEVEFRPDPGVNSGVQFRSHSRPDYQDGRVHGYQYEIDATPRALTGALYEERARKWLVPTEDPGERAKWKPRGSRLKVGEWNQLRIECRGQSVRTWLNGKLMVDFQDPVPTEAGFIALQVHGTRDPTMVGKTVQWRRLRVRAY